MHSKSELALAGELFELLELIAVQTVLNQIQADDQTVECARAGDREISAAALAGQSGQQHLRIIRKESARTRQGQGRPSNAASAD